MNLAVTNQPFLQLHKKLPTLQMNLLPLLIVHNVYDAFIKRFIVSQP